MQEYRYELKVPKERVAVIIGEGGKTKRELEALTTAKINVDSTEGDITITGKDSLMLYQAKEIIRAIARGFNPDIAKLLIKPDYTFDSINLNDYARSPTDLERLKGRIIGQDGKARRTLQELTKTDICVYGKTVGIIGYAENIMATRRAIESLIEGSRHGNVYKTLEKRRSYKEEAPTHEYSS